MSSISFGSVGDIISVCLLIKDVVDALDQSRGSSPEYQALVRELGSLERALLQVDLLLRSHSQSAGIDDICNAARQPLEHCKTSLQNFTKRISRYDPALRENGGRSLLRDAMKVRWRAAEKDTVSRFRAEVTAHINAITMLLATANVKLIQESAHKIEELKSCARTTGRHHDGQLLRVLDKLGHITALLFSGKALLEKLWGGLKWLQRISLDVKASINQVLLLNVATHNAVLAVQSGLPARLADINRILSLNVITYNAVLAIHSKLPSRLERSLIGDPAVFEDALGRIAPVHLQFINSWEAFDAVLDVRFRGLDGHDKILSKDFVLQEHGSGFEIPRSRPWEASILPGRRFEMSFVFSKKAGVTSNTTDTSCPKCGFVSSEEQDTEVQCAKCDLFYRRIIEVEEIEPTVPGPTLVGQRSQPVFGQSAFGPEPPPTSSFSKRKREDGFDDALVRFKRVRLVSKQFKPRPRAIFGGSQPIQWPTADSNLFASSTSYNPRVLEVPADGAAEDPNLNDTLSVSSSEDSNDTLSLLSSEDSIAISSPVDIDPNLNDTLSVSSSEDTNNTLSLLSSNDSEVFYRLYTSNVISLPGWSNGQIQGQSRQ